MFKSKNILNYIIIFIVAFIVFSDSVFATSRLCTYSDDKGNSFTLVINNTTKEVSLRSGMKLEKCNNKADLKISYSAFKKGTDGLATCNLNYDKKPGLTYNRDTLSNIETCTITSNGAFQLTGDVVTRDSQEKELEQVECEDILGDDFIDFLKKIFRWIQIIAPIIVIVLGSVDFASAILQDDKDALKKASNKLIKRLIIAIALFLLPILINFLLDNFNVVKGSNAGTCGIGE